MQSHRSGERVMYEDKDPWPFRCPQCGNEFTEEIGRLKAQTPNVEVKCPGKLGVEATGRPIHIDVIDIVRVEEGRYAEHWGVNTLSTVIANLKRGDPYNG